VAQTTVARATAEEALLNAAERLLVDGDAAARAAALIAELL
jgi:hypothetical protein